MISESSCLSREQLTVVQQIFASIRQVQRIEDFSFTTHTDMRPVAIRLEKLLSELVVDIGWEISVISVTHHTSNIILACKHQNRVGNSFILKIEASSLPGFKTLLSEVAYYRMHQNRHLPAFLGYFSEADLNAIALEYLKGYRKLSSFLWEENTPKLEVRTLLVSILTWIGFDLFLSGQIQKLSVDERWDAFKKFFLDRALSRLRENTVIDSPLGKVAALRNCRVNDIALPGPVELLNMIMDSGRFISNNLPPLLGSIHGDLHFGNILVRTEGNRTLSPRFVLVDPRYCRPAPIIYDLGKMYQSFLGHYEAIMRSAYTIERSAHNNFMLHFSEPLHFVAFGEEFEECVNNSPFGLEIKSSGIDLRSICALSAGIHLMAAAPHHILSADEAVSMLLWGCWLSFSAFENLKSGLK